MSYSIKEQVCSLEQAKELAELLGDDAPESLWVRAEFWDGESVIWLSGERPAFPSAVKKRYPAYNGDELGALLLNGLPGGFFGTQSMPPLARGRARLAIQGLREGWIKKEEFRYE